MSFEPVTRWVLRCDGTTTCQCTQQFVYPDDPDDIDSPLAVWWPAVYEQPELGVDVCADLRCAGWLVVRDGRILCPRHVAGLEYLARAAIDGLPFDGEDAR